MVQHQLAFEKPIYDLEDQLKKLESEPDPTPALQDSIRRMRVELTQITRELYKNLDPWQIVQVSRHPERPHLVGDEFGRNHQRSVGHSGD